LSRYRWVVLAAGTVAAASYSAVLIGVSAIAPQVRAHYHLGLTEVGIVLAASGIGSMFTLLPWGLLTDRVGERAVMAVGLSGSAAALFAAPAVGSFAGLVALLVLAGAAGASVNAASGRAVMGWFAREERGLALGIRQTAIPIGGALAAVGLPWIASSAGVRWTFAALGGGCLVGALAGAIWLREPPLAEPAVGDPLHGPVRDRAMWVLSGGSVLYVVAQMAVTNFVVLFLHVHRGVSARHAADVLALTQALGVGARIGAGRWSDRVGSRIAPLRRIGLLIAVATAAVTALVDAPLWLTVPAFVVAGVLGLAWNGLAFTAAAETAGAGRSGAAIGFQQTALAVGAAPVPIVFAAIVNGASWRVAYGLAALTPLLGVAVLRRFPRAPSKGH
jgi:MFS family permease